MFWKNSWKAKLYWNSILLFQYWIQHSQQHFLKISFTFLIKRWNVTLQNIWQSSVIYIKYQKDILKTIYLKKLNWSVLPHWCTKTELFKIHSYGLGKTLPNPITVFNTPLKQLEVYRKLPWKSKNCVSQKLWILYLNIVCECFKYSQLISFQWMLFRSAWNTDVPTNNLSEI